MHLDTAPSTSLATAMPTLQHLVPGSLTTSLVIQGGRDAGPEGRGCSVVPSVMVYEVSFARDHRSRAFCCSATPVVADTPAPHSAGATFMLGVHHGHRNRQVVQR